ncbi:MAG: indolepyruvate ferredoxin oxidoreductase subunit alpha [Desulfurococcaceae archaeon]
MNEHPLLKARGEKVLLLGNEAIARGALEAGVCFAAGYPGTPSTEVIEAISEVAQHCGVYVEWSVNEKVAFEAAYGAAISGVRSLVSMKHVGLNVAADILMSSAYSGVEEGFVIVSADDPSQHSSQNEQDNRWYGFIAHIPVIEPSNAREAYRLIKVAYDVSSRYKQPVIFRTTTRISHTRMPVVLENDIPESRKCKGTFIKDNERWVLVPAHSRKMKIRMMNAWKAIAENENRESLIKVMNPGMKTAIIASGLAYSYTSEALRILGYWDKVTLVKVNMPVPLPRTPVKSVLEYSERILVVEELDPVVELQVKSLVAELDAKVKVHGKDIVPENGELDLDVVVKTLSKFLNVNPPGTWKSIGAVEISPPIPPRPPVLCAGCPHRSTYYIFKVASNRANLKNVIYTGDIGCYTLGYQKPFDMQHTCFEMGGSIGVAHGLSKTVDNPVVAVIGDSTFFHAGLPPALNIVYNRGRAVVLVLDNITTAMTGHQPHPGTGLTATGEKTKRVLPEDVLRSLGFETYVINPLMVRESVETVQKALERYKQGVNVSVVSRMRCALEVLREARRRKITLPVYSVLEDKCTGCSACINLTACPAIVPDPKTGKPRIIGELCAGCGLCAYVCPYKAIVIANKPSEEWEKLWWEL